MTKGFQQIEQRENGDLFQITTSMELLPFLYDAYANRSRNSIKSMLRRGQVFVNDRETTQFNEKLKKHDRVFVMHNRIAQARSQLVGLKILYEDAHLIAVWKEAGLLSIATGKDDELTAFSQVMEYVRNKRRSNRIFIVHRLDRDTSGVMLFAKSARIQNEFREHWRRLVKVRLYVALVEGKVTKKRGTITSYLKEGPHYQMYSVNKNEGGKRAVTHYEVKKAKAHYSLIELSLETGRKNQIRVHMKDIGHPVVGDYKYGATKNPLKRLGLHANELGFIHPVTNKFVKINAPIPKKMLQFI